MYVCHVYNMHSCYNSTIAFYVQFENPLTFNYNSLLRLSSRSSLARHPTPTSLPWLWFHQPTTAADRRALKNLWSCIQPFPRRLNSFGTRTVTRRSSYPQCSAHLRFVQGGTNCSLEKNEIHVEQEITKIVRVQYRWNKNVPKHSKTSTTTLRKM